MSERRKIYCRKKSHSALESGMFVEHIKLKDIIRILQTAAVTGVFLRC